MRSIAIITLAALALVATSALAQRNSQPPRYHVISVPSAVGTGEGKETHVVLETAHVKLATIALRRGTPLEEHSAPTPVTIQVLSGRGVIELGDRKEAVGPGSLLALSPGVKHLVRPESGGDMMLLVHHLKAPAGRRRPGGTP